MTQLDWQPFWDHVRHLTDHHKLPGLAVAASRDGRTVLSGALGFRDREAELAATPETVFGIGSVTKSFTAVVIMQLEEEGRLNVEDPVVKYLPEFRIKDPSGTAGMTIHHFLTHSSGLPPLPSLMYTLAGSIMADEVGGAQIVKAGIFDKHGPIETAEELMDFIADLDFEVLAPPGVQVSYSNDSWALLGAIIERVTGRPYADVVTERILKPLGMSRTGFAIRDLEALGNVTTCYTRVKGDAAEPEVKAAPLWWEAPAMVSAGFLRSTVVDLLRYLEVFRTGGRTGGARVLSARSVERMTTPYVDFTPGSGYGYGLRITPDYHGMTLIEHSGGIKGVSAYVSVVPEAGASIAALANLDNFPSGAVSLAAVNTLAGLPIRTPRIAVHDYKYPAWHLKRLAGAYLSAEGLSSSVKLTVEKGELRARVGDKTLTARFFGPWTCIAKEDEEDEGTTVRALTGRDGRVWAIMAGGRVLVRAEKA